MGYHLAPHARDVLTGWHRYVRDLDATDDQNRRGRKRGRHHEPDPHAFHDAEAGNDGAADRRRKHDRDSSYDGLKGESPRALAFWQRVADDGEQHRAGHADPCHDQNESDERNRPRGNCRVHDVANERDADERDESRSSSESVSDPAPRILIGPVEKVAKRSVETDRRNGCAQSLEVLWNKPLPQLLAERKRERRDRDGDDVPIEVEPTWRIRAGVVQWRRVLSFALVSGATHCATSPYTDNDGTPETTTKCFLVVLSVSPVVIRSEDVDS
jgi:hypothetical protein